MQKGGMLLCNIFSTFSTCILESSTALLVNENFQHLCLGELQCLLFNKLYAVRYFKYDLCYAGIQIWYISKLEASKCPCTFPFGLIGRFRADQNPSLFLSHSPLLWSCNIALAFEHTVLQHVPWTSLARSITVDYIVFGYNTTKLYISFFLMHIFRLTFAIFSERETFGNQLCVCW